MAMNPNPVDGASACGIQGCPIRNNQNCHYSISGVSLYPIIFSIRRPFWGPKTVPLSYIFCIQNRPKVIKCGFLDCRSVGDRVQEGPHHVPLQRHDGRPDHRGCEIANLLDSIHKRVS